MNYTKVLVIGAHSSIASFVMPKLDFDKNSIYAISRREINESLTWMPQENVFISNYPLSEDFMIQLVSKLDKGNSNNILVINFAGSFGIPTAIKNFDIEEANKVLSENVTQFLSAVQLYLKFPKNSFFLGFSGAGVGGDTMDGYSLGYLLSKISLCGLVEVLDANLKDENKRIALIAPGPFPSGMQSAVANAPAGVVTEEARFQAMTIKAEEINLTRLTDAIKWVVSNPNLSGGRTWSAQRDNFSSERLSERFGFLRRVID